MSENNKFAVGKCFDEFLEQQFLYAGKALFYDILKSHGYIDPPKKDVIESCRKAINILLEKDNKLPERQRKPYLYNRNSCFMVKNKAKVLILESFFAKIDAEGKHITEIII